MSRIAIVSDSAANLLPDLLARYSIHVVPLLVQLDRKTLRDGLDPLPPGFYQHMSLNGASLTTSAPSAGDFLRMYASLAASGQTILSIHTSSRMSSIYQTARVASEMIDGAAIHVIDSGSAAMGHGFVVLEAARAVAQGNDIETVLQRIDDVAKRVNIVATLSDLRHLVRSGRVPAAVGLAGSFLQICPIFSLRHGQARLLEIRRTRQNAKQRIVELVTKEVGSRPVHVAVFHGQTPEEAGILKDEIAARLNCVEAYVTEFTAAMAVHTGPDVLGVAFFAEDEARES